MLKNITFILIVLLVMLSGCTSRPYTMKDNGHTAELDMDSPFEIELTGNSSAGYSWKVVKIDTNVIKQIGKPGYVPSDDRTGSAGTYIFRFQTVDYGETELVLTYSRTGQPPAKTFRMKIISGTMGRILGE